MEAESTGSVIPPDIAICDDCIRELRNPEDPRFEYFFITCTNCGPRFTIIEKLPYDRENTTMREFPLCGFCLKEYRDPLNRRFHAQTVACPRCGPHVFLTDSEGKVLQEDDPIRTAGQLLSEGSILVIKGVGGFHIAASAEKPQPLARLRRVKHRSEKPFAVMARSLETARSFAEITENQAEILTSYVRPIVLLNKAQEYYLSELVAPRLHNIGVMLPYTGLHYLLFDRVRDAAFVMTSANPPSEPIMKDNNEALETLRDTADYFLLHNRQIAHRCDDSVVRVHGTNTVLIRRSRGYSPAPITLKKKSKHCVLGIGGELNNASCILNDDKAFLSQHIGDVQNVETRALLEDATNHLARLTNNRIEAIACDLHPKFVTTNLAEHWAEEKGWKLTRVQHHHAHIAGLMAEHNLQEIIGICCDGYGYGTDGQAWGGEILLCRNNTVSFKRLAHLEPQPLIGGDFATYYPLRMAAGILQDSVNIEEFLLKNRKHFPHGNEEVRIVLQQLAKRENSLHTTSCGRVLDAVSAILNVCYERTYEGEPSMKLESIALKGRDALKLNPIIKRDVLNTKEMVLDIYENKEKCTASDLAFSAHTYLAKGLADMAIMKATENNVNAVGFSGGVACNEIMVSIIGKLVETSGFRFLVHSSIPPGDGGLSFGQAVVSGFFDS
jgi:hydrogenase maturation protein HypF